MGTLSRSPITVEQVAEGHGVADFGTHSMS